MTVASMNPFSSTNSLPGEADLTVLLGDKAQGVHTKCSWVLGKSAGSPSPSLGREVCLDGPLKQHSSPAPSSSGPTSSPLRGPISGHLGPQ